MNRVGAENHGEGVLRSDHGGPGRRHLVLAWVQSTIYKEFGSFLDHRERDPLTSHSFSSLEIRTRNRRPPASCGSEEFEVS